MNVTKEMTLNDLESSKDDEECSRESQSLRRSVNKWTILGGIFASIIFSTTLFAFCHYDKMYNNVSNSNLNVQQLDVQNVRNLAVAPTSSPSVLSSEWDLNWFQLGNDIIGTYSEDGAGTSITVSRNGLAIAVGAPGSEVPYGYSGFQWSNTYIYKYISNTWLQVAEIPDVYSFDRSGQSVALDDTGSIVAIGSPFDTRVTDIDPNITKYPGTVRIYKITNAKTNEPWDPKNWDQIGYNITGYIDDDEFGWTLDLSNDGNTIAIGARKGCYVQNYKYSSIDDVWKKVGQRIKCSGYYYDFYDTSISTRISGDGKTIVLGEPSSMISKDSSCSSTGRITMYRFSGGSWKRLGVSILGDSCEDEFGYSVDISDNGNIVTACSPKDRLDRPFIQATDTSINPSIGSCKIFKWNTVKNKWLPLGQKMNGTSLLDMYGSSVSLSSNGNVVAIGAVGSNVNGDDSGSVQILEYNGVANSWYQVGDMIEGKYPFASSGKSVALSSKGDIVTIGATNEKLPGSDLQGSARVYETGVQAPVGTINITVVLNISDDAYPPGISWFIDRLDVELDEEMHVYAVNDHTYTYYDTNRVDTITVMVPYGVYRFFGILPEAFATVYVDNAKVATNLTENAQYTFLADDNNHIKKVMNNSTSKSSSVTLLINFDKHPYDIHWVLLKTNKESSMNLLLHQPKRTVVNYGPIKEYKSGYSNKRYKKRINITDVTTDDKFVFILTDDGRDGLCCEYGSGYIQMNQQNLKVIFNTSAEDMYRFVHHFSIV